MLIMLRCLQQRVFAVAIKFKLLLLLICIIFSITAVQAHGGACGCSSLASTGLAGPIITIPAYNMKQGITSVSLGFGFHNSGRLNGSQIRTVSSAGTDHADDNYGSLTQILAVSHGITDRISISAVVPFVESLGFREVTGDGVTPQGSSIGFGDITLLAKYNFYDKHRFQSALMAGIELPTGATNVQADNNERFEATNQPGSGSFDPIFGIAFSKQIKKIGIDSNFMYKISTQGAQNSIIGDVANYNLALSYALNHEHEDEFHHHHDEGSKGLIEKILPQHVLGNHLTWDLIMEANAIWQEAPVSDGLASANHGGTTVYLSPGARIVVNDSWVYNFSLGFPVIEDLNGIQGGTDLQLSFSVATSF